MALHPQAAKFLKELAAQDPPAWDKLPVEEARELFASLDGLFGEPEAVQHVRDIQLDEGFRLRVYHPDPGRKLPVVLYFHGGGWVLGDCDTHDALCRDLANHSSCCVVSVDYRRAPEHKCPQGLEDCVTALAYIADNAQSLNIDSKQIGVAGDSAGGNLAAALALRTLGNGLPRLACQLLIYPVIEPNFSTSSYTSFADGFGVTRASMIYFWRCYLANEEQGTSPDAAPSRATSLATLPKAHVMTAEFDVLRDEGEAYAQQLTQAGVPTTHKQYDGMLHGFVHFCAPFDDARRARDDAAQFLRTTLHHQP